MFKPMFLTLVLLVVVVGCGGGRQGLARPVTMTTDERVLNTRAVVLATPADPQSEQQAQEWARIAADRERQQMEYDLRKQERNDRRAQQYAYQAAQKERAKAYNERIKDQQKLDAVRDLGYQAESLLSQVRYNRSQRAR